MRVVGGGHNDAHSLQHGEGIGEMKHHLWVGHNRGTWPARHLSVYNDVGIDKSPDSAQWITKMLEKEKRACLWRSFNKKVVDVSKCTGPC